MISSLLDERNELGRKLIVHENRAYWTGHNTGTTPDALIRVNEKLIITLVNAIAWTNFHAGRIFGSDTRLGNHRRVTHDLEYGRAIRQCP
jgi:hypothetical protein